MWKAKTENLQKGEVTKYYLSEKDQQLTFADVLQLWQENSAFGNFFSSLLANASFSAFFWECPPLTKSSLTMPFEFVLVNSPQLVGIRADLQAFGRHFVSTDQSVCDFTNLGGDAHLLAPFPVETENYYAHLAVFVRNTKRSQQQALWQRLGELVEEKVSQKPLWMSTSGLGVYWLHVRLDSHPKYYQFAPYRHDVD